MVSGVSVRCPPATKRALWVKSILTSKTMWHLISVNPISSFPALTHSISRLSRASQAIRTFRNSFSITFAQKSVPVSLSIHSASSASFGSLMPNLWVVHQYLGLSLEMICARRCSPVSCALPHIQQAQWGCGP